MVPLFVGSGRMWGVSAGGWCGGALVRRVRSVHRSRPSPDRSDGRLVGRLGEVGLLGWRVVRWCPGSSGPSGASGPAGRARVPAEFGSVWWASGRSFG